MGKEHYWGTSRVMVRINFIVEGQTEEAFVNSLLLEPLAAHGVYACARSVETGRHGSKIYRGGITNYNKAKNDILRWLNQDMQAYVTTMFDYYALPNDFPGYAEALAETNSYNKVSLIQDAMSQDIDNIRFIPYIQLHEFEAILFSNVDKVDECMELYGQNGQIASLNAINNNYTSPEHINTTPTGAPSKRLHSMYPSYDKVFLGSLISEEIGLETIKNKCVHFNNWLTKLTSLSAA